ncbi:hypothetical protein [Streptomyces malaysiensis]|uniref:hypothetical protein n=1 Tax=Streptomyces malaysiensis TaxID=92644 RepID=UPI0027427A5B|nr:hypothetical protein [Streptomyces samsunensis]
MFSPNEKYAALVETAGYLPLALSAEDYLELLPTRWQAVNSYGHQGQPPHLRLRRAERTAPGEVRDHRAEEPVGGPS